MATLNIEGQKITIDDAFLKESPEKQNAIVQDIGRKLGLKPQQTPEAGLGERLDQAAVAAAKGVARGTEFAASALNPVRLIKDTINSARGVITGKPGPGTTPPATPISSALEKVAPAPTDPFGKVMTDTVEAMANPISMVGKASIVAKLIAAGVSGAGAAIGEMAGGKAGAVAGSMLGGLTGWTKLKITPGLQAEAKKLYRTAQTPEEFHLLDAIILGDESRASKLQVANALKNVMGPTWSALKLAARPTPNRIMDAAIDLFLKRMQARAMGQPTMDKLKGLISQHSYQPGTYAIRAGRAGAREVEKQYGGVE